MSELRPPHAPVKEYDEHHNLVYVDPRQRGETMAFAAQSIVYNIAGNFFEPYVNLRVQKYYSSHDASHSMKAGNYSQNLAGEFAGDLIGSGGLMLAEAVAPVQLHTLTRSLRAAIDPIYRQIAPPSNTEYGPESKKQEDAIIAQERLLVRSALVTVGTVAGNILTQKTLIQNPAPVKVIFMGKLASSVLTTCLGLAARSIFPNQSQGMDRWMSKKIFTPMFEDDAAPEASRGR